MSTSYRHIILIFLFDLLLITPIIVSGQSGFSSESEMKAKAEEYFNSDQFKLAFPIYSQLLSLDSENPELNYRFGVCLMYSDRSNTEEPILYLEKAINKVTDNDFYYHLALAYHNNYFFTDAIYNYRKYLQLAKNNARKEYDAERKIAMCQNGIDLLRAVDNLYVIEKSEVDRKAFYRSYNLMDYGGRILHLPKEFLNKNDLKNQGDNVAYYNPTAKLLFYALNNKNQKDIYYRIQQKNNEWSAALALPSVINTEFDEDYPVFMPDGKTLYFSSKGHNSMGGYDIFQSVYDSITSQWSEPVNLSFPFNTPSDDILFISNADETLAWFASDRNSVSDKITVYKVGIIKKENQTANLSDVYSKDQLSENDLGRIKNMALLDINISDRAFKEIPVEKMRKIDALLKNDATRITQNIRQANLVNVDKQLEVQKKQSNLSDSIKSVVVRVDSKLETLKSLYLQTQYLGTAKESTVQQGYSDLALHLENAQKTNVSSQKKEFIKNANKTLFRTLRLNFQYEQINTIVKQLDKQIAAQRSLLSQVTDLFGDIQKSIVTQDDNATRNSIKRLDELIRSADTLTNYTKLIDYSKGELINPKYPPNLSSENSFTVYYLYNESKFAPIMATEPRFATYIPKAIESAGSQNIALSEPAKINKLQGVNTSNNPVQKIREEINALSNRQAKWLDWLKQQSALLTKKASDKLDASNSALVDFEQIREQYNQGQISDKNSVIAKQTESQNLLYQSLAIIGLAEKADSLYQAGEKRNKEFVDQIFAIEQALQSNQISTAQTMFNTLEEKINIPILQQENLVLNWIESSINRIPSQRKEANLALENAQKLTDDALHLETEANDLKEEAKSKSNAFKRRQLLIDADEKQALANQKQRDSEKLLALSNNLNENIRKAKAIQLIRDEFSSSVLLSQNPILIINPEKRLDELSARIEVREQAFSPINSSNDIQLSQEKNLQYNPAIVPIMNDLISYSTKRFKAQLLAEELDINKRETVYLLDLGKNLSGAAAIENTQKITVLRKEADSLQNASTLAFMEAGNIYKQLPAEDKKLADNSKNDFENYLNNIRNRIAQLLDDVILLGKQAQTAEDEADRGKLKLQAEQKEQIAMYLILEEFEIIARRNQQNFRKNALIINELVNKNLNAQEQGLMKPIFGQIESKTQLAFNKRIKAKNNDLSFRLKKILLQDAFTDESGALDLQLEAIRMMREKDTNSMLAYQQTNQTPVRNETIASKENAVAQNISVEPNTNIPQKIIPKSPEINKENVVLAKTDFVIKEKVPAETRKQNTNALPVSDFNAMTTPKSSSAFPYVSLSQEPRGIQFSVQIAAIGGLKTTDNFLNVMELFAIKDSDKDLYRYFSGKFTALKAAVLRRNSLRRQGYSDAFIKSWKDGKVVSMFEAAGEIDEATLALLNETVISLPSQYKNINFSATNISQLTGVYYSVQVGVYSRPRSSANLFNIKPLYHNRLNNGLWVYFNGIFKSIAAAEENKTIVRSKGVSDAFVVAFKEGEKVSLVTAVKAIKQGNPYPANEDIIILDEAANSVDSQLMTISEHTKTAAKSRTYKVQIGVFSHPVSFEWLTEKISNSQSNKVDYLKSSTGKYVYTIGSFNSYEEATKFNTERVKALVRDAFVVAFENNTKVNLSK